MDLEKETRKLRRGVQKLGINDENTREPNGAFSQHFFPALSTCFTKGKKAKHRVIHSDLSCDQGTVLCGLNNDHLVSFDVHTSPSLTSLSVADVSPRTHNGLSCLRCSKVDPKIFYSSSTEDGLLLQWDLRTKHKPVQTYSVDTAEASTTGLKKPLLSFDVSQDDTVLCAGTELVKEDSYLLFWDRRSTSLLGGFWEGHSDDVTAVQFHPSASHSIASGSTDGLLNVYDLLQPTEDEALLYSFNTVSSVDQIGWRDAPGRKPMTSGASSLGHVACITHTNEMRVWDTGSGDPVGSFSRASIAETLMRTNPDAVHLNGLYQGSGSEGGFGFGVLACSLSGDCARFLELTDEHVLGPKSLLTDQSSVIQTAEYLSKENRWVTFDEDGSIKVWSREDRGQVHQSESRGGDSVIGHHKNGDKRFTRFQPYENRRDKKAQKVLD